MFLSQLSVTNREKFLKLCVFASISNEIFADEEKVMIEQYCREMNMEVMIPEVNETFEELISECNEQMTGVEKKIVLLEIFAVIKSDGIFDDKEKTFMKKMKECFDISDTVYNDISAMYDEYIDLAKRIAQVVCS